MYSLFDYNFFTDEFLETYIIDLKESPFKVSTEDCEDLHKVFNENSAYKLNSFI